MLKNIPDILSPDLLHALRAMGHGDRIVIADANFPGTSVGQRCIRLEGLTATDVLEAVLMLMPIDTFCDDPVVTMQVVGDPGARPEIVSEFQLIVDRHAEKPSPIVPVERFAFYEQAKVAYAVIQTGEKRLYGNVIVAKGVIGK